jgi:hypothetical protein
VASAGSSGSDGARGTQHVESIRKSASVIRFFEHHPRLLRDARFSTEARRKLTAARSSLAVARANAARERARIERSARSTREAAQRRLMAKLSRSPANAVCYVFGDYCGQALRVARCESGLQTTAQNGQYLGLFQMGSSARQLFGHGQSALAQARAAYRYFVRSGRDWGPWSCKPWY